MFAVKWLTITIEAKPAANANPSFPKANNDNGIPIFPVFGCINGVVNFIEGSLKIFINKYPNKKPIAKTKKAERKIEKLEDKVKEARNEQKKNASENEVLEKKVSSIEIKNTEFLEEKLNLQMKLL